MAFALTLDPQQTGMACGYWRITHAHLDHLQAAVTVWLHGWRDEPARHAGCAPAASLTLHMEAQDFPTGLHAADTAALYAALRQRAAQDDQQGGMPAVPGTDPAILRDATDC